MRPSAAKQVKFVVSMPQYTELLSGLLRTAMLKSRCRLSITLAAQSWSVSTFTSRSFMTSNLGNHFHGEPSLFPAIPAQLMKRFTKQSSALLNPATWTLAW